MIKEACVENLPAARRAQVLGADQIELCGRLDLDGLTPNDPLIKDALAQLGIHVKVMVRLRGGNFVYADSEVDEMLATIRRLKSMGVKEIVLGALTEDFGLDLSAITRMVAEARPMKVTFHKAIDQLADPVAGVRQLMKINGITSVLTSGGQATAAAGAAVISQMIDIAGDQIQIIAAGKITNENLAETFELIGAEAYHGKLIVGSLH